MIDKFKNITLGHGMGLIKFGSSRQEIETLLGKPDEIEQFNYGDEAEGKTESWHFDDYEFSLSFDEDSNWKLTGIAVSSPDFLFNEKSLIGMEREELMTEINSLDYGELELEELPIEEDISHTLISFDAVSLNFWFEDEILTEIQWGPFWGENSGPIWPK